MVQALHGHPKWDPALVRAREIANRSRNQLEQEQEKERGPKSVHARIRTVQRKIGNAKKKLEKLHEQRAELRQEFEEIDGRFAENEEEWREKLKKLEEQYASDCHEVATERACSTVQTDAAKSTASIDRAGSVVQELLSQIESEEVRKLLLKVSEDLEGAKLSIGQMAQGDETLQGTEQGKTEYHDLADDGPTGKEAEADDSIPVRPPINWMQKQKSTEQNKGTGKGKGEQKKQMGNVAKQFRDVQEQHQRRPTHEEEVEMARRVVSALDDKHKGQQLSEEFKRALLDEAMREMAAWIQSGGAKLHAKSTTEEYLDGMATMARCGTRIEEAMVLLATRRAEEARASEVIANSTA